MKTYLLFIMISLLYVWQIAMADTISQIPDGELISSFLGGSHNFKVSKRVDDKDEYLWKDEKKSYFYSITRSDKSRKVTFLKPFINYSKLKNVLENRKEYLVSTGHEKGRFFYVLDEKGRKWVFRNNSSMQLVSILQSEQVKK